MLSIAEAGFLVLKKNYKTLIIQASFIFAELSIRLPFLWLFYPIRGESFL